MEIIGVKFMPIKRRSSAKLSRDQSSSSSDINHHQEADKKPPNIRLANEKQNYQIAKLSYTKSSVLTLAQILLLIIIIIIVQQQTAEASERMVRLCIASVDPVKLSSQCVMCNRREFPLTVIDCTGITKVNDLIANPLSVQEATCLIYNCRRQVPDVKPEPYHGSVSHAANYRGASSSSSSSSSSSPSGYSPFGFNGGGGGHSATGSRNYEMMTPSGMFGSSYSAGLGMQPLGMGPGPPPSMYMSRYGVTNYGPGSAASMYPPASMAMSPLIPKGLIGGPRGMPDRHTQGPLPYALVPASSFPFGSRKYKMALMPLFK